VSCNLYNSDPTTRRKKGREISSWLANKGELILDSEPDMVYTVIACNHDINAEPRGYDLPVDDFKIIFECYPHPKNTYYNDNVSWSEMDSTWVNLNLPWSGYEQTFDVVSGNSINLYNLGSYKTKPIITIFGIASSVTIGEFTFTNLNGLVTIDCDAEVVYSGSGESITNQFHNFSGKFPVLNPGVNTFPISGSITNLTVSFDYKNTYL
jgi:phage-related protein